MKSKKIEAAFDEFKTIIESGPISSEYKHEDKHRRAILENTMKTYKAFLSAGVYDDMDDERLFDVSINELDDEVSGKEIIDRMTDVIGFFYKLRAKLLESSARFCKNGADYFNVIAKKYNLNYIKQDKKVERRINKAI